MKTIDHWAKACSLVFMIALAGCLTDADTVAGIEGTGGPETASGSVTSYGSIFVNGERIDISAADIEVNGARVMESAVELGMVVRIEAERDGEGRIVAQRVRYDRQLLGRVSEVVDSTATRTVLKVLGQTLVVHDDVVFADIGFDALVEGTVLDVSGFVDAEGRLVASRIASASASAEHEVRGQVQGLNRDDMRFQLRELSVHYADASFEGGSKDDLDNEKSVAVSGSLDGDILIASRIVFTDEELELKEGARASREGLVQSIESLSNFRLDGLPVNATHAEFAGGDAGQLKVGVRVAVVGSLENGTLQAQQVRLLLPGIYRAWGMVEDIDPASGEFVVMGTTYTSNRLTAFEDRGPNPNRLINMSEIRVGDYVEVFARYSGDQLITTRIKRVDEGDETVSLRGPVTRIDLDNEQISVMGVSVDLQEATGGALIADLVRGDIVIVEGRLSGQGSITASALMLPELPGLEACPEPVGEACDDLPNGRQAGFGADLSPSFRF